MQLAGVVWILIVINKNKIDTSGLISEQSSVSGSYPLGDNLHWSLRVLWSWVGFTVYIATSEVLHC